MSETFTKPTNTATGAHGWTVHENGLMGTWQWSAFGPNAGQAGIAKTKDDARVAALYSYHWLKAHGTTH